MAQFPHSALPPSLPAPSFPPALRPLLLLFVWLHSVKNLGKVKIREITWQGRTLLQADEVLMCCKCCLCHRGIQTAWQQRNKWRKGEGEWLISNRNKILRKHACCQAELALPYCLAAGVCTPHTPVCMCVYVCACANLFLLMYPVNPRVHSFICVSRTHW